MFEDYYHGKRPKRRGAKAAVRSGNYRIRCIRAAAGIGSLTIMVVGLQAAPANADDGGYLVQSDSGGSVNIRSGPGTEYPVVGSLDSGDEVQIFCTSLDSNGALWDSIAAPAPGGYMVLDALIETGTNEPVAPSCEETQTVQDTIEAELAPAAGTSGEWLASQAKAAAIGCVTAVGSGLVVDVIVTGVTGGTGVVIVGPKMAVECVVGAVTPGAGQLIKWWITGGNGIPDQEYPFEFRNPPMTPTAPYTGQPSPSPGPSPVPPSH